MSVTESEVKQILKKLSQVYPNTPAMKKGTAAAYQMILAPLGAELVAAAAIQAARQSPKFFPAAGAIYQAAMELVDEEVPASVAWGIALRVSKNPNWGDAGWTSRIEAAVNDSMGSLKALEMASDSESMANRARFIEAYKARGYMERQRLLTLPQNANLQLVAPND